MIFTASLFFWWQKGEKGNLMTQRLPEETVNDVVSLLKTGMPQQRIARDMHISQSSVARIKKKYLKGEDMDSIFAGDKYHGVIKATGNDVFEGTCRGKNGKMYKKIFRCKGSKEAREQWEAWCAAIRQYDKDKSQAKNGKADIPEPITVTKPDKIPTDVPTEKVGVRYTPAKPAVIYGAATPPERPVTHVKMPESEKPESEQPTPRRELEADEIYILAVGNPKMAGFFVDFQQAMQTEALMNTALEMAGFESRYQVVAVKKYQAPTV